MSNMDRVIQKIKTLPPLVKKASEALAALRDPDVPVNKVVSIIQYDPSMTANILRYCNSPVCGLPRQITSIQQAVVLIGLKKLRTLLLTSAVEKYFSGDLPGYEGQRFELWRHCLAVALIAEHVAETTRAVPPDEAFTAGLLHDIGKVVTSQFLAEERARWEENPLLAGDFPTLERDVLGMDHMEVGAQVLARWDFPQPFQDVARLHHNPPLQDRLDLVGVVHIADVEAILAGWNTTVDALHYRAKPEIFAQAGIRLSGLQETLGSLVDRVAALEQELFGKGSR